MKKIIVTGGLGFIGSNLIDLLLKKNFYVINIDKRTYSSNLYNTKDFKRSRNYKFLKLDIANKKIEKILTRYKPSGVFNLAAETHVDRSIDNPGSFIKSNVVGVYNLLECFKNFSKKNKSKLIHISTDEVYGDVLSGRTDENHSYKPSSPYAASKAASDHLVSSYIRTYNLPAIVTTDLRLNEPRYASLPNIMKAKSKPLDVIPASDLGIDIATRLETLKVSLPAEREAGVIVETVDELIDKLKNEAKVIS